MLGSSRCSSGSARCFSCSRLRQLARIARDLTGFNQKVDDADVTGY
jgi:hypothetical protein